MTLRRATVEDLPVVLGHRERMFAEMGHPPDDVASESSRVFFTAAMADGRYHGWLIEAEGRVIAGGGIILIEFQPGPVQPGRFRPYVVNMWTEPEHRGRGLARRLMTEMIEWARANGYGFLSLHASEAGRPLYEQLGFTPTNEMRLKLGV